MNKERQNRNALGFNFSENEVQIYQVSHERFLLIFADPDTTVHKIGTSDSSYGEFLFVTLSHKSGQNLNPITFYGQGFHEHRRSWVSREWFWYKANTSASRFNQRVDKKVAFDILKARLDEVDLFTEEARQTMRARVCDMFAEMTDDDEVLNEIADYESNDNH